MLPSGDASGADCRCPLVSSPRLRSAPRLTFPTRRNDGVGHVTSKINICTQKCQTNHGKDVNGLTPSSPTNVLEGVIDALASSPQLGLEQRDQATRIFNAIIEASEPLQHSKGSYKQITLVGLTYEYARSEASRDTFLRFFFQQT